MKKTFFTFSILIFLTVIGCTQTDESKVDSKQAEITFEKLTHDFGTITKGSDATYEFTFKNTGKAPLTLTNVKSSCGCTVPSWSREPIKKGKTGSIKVKYNTRTPGTFSKSVTVSSNSSNPTVVLRIKGKVVAQSANTDTAK